MEAFIYGENNNNIYSFSKKKNLNKLKFTSIGLEFSWIKLEFIGIKLISFALNYI